MLNDLKQFADKRSKAVSEPFQLLPEDTEYLESNFPGRWQKLTENTGKFAIQIESISVPSGLSPDKVDLMILVPVGYPAAAIDMFYLDPSLCRNDQREIPNLCIERHFERDWQRWSRHYDWQVGRDNLYKHIEYVQEELKKAAPPNENPKTKLN